MPFCFVSPAVAAASAVAAGLVDLGRLTVGCAVGPPVAAAAAVAAGLVDRRGVRRMLGSFGQNFDGAAAVAAAAPVVLALLTFAAAAAAVLVLRLPCSCCFEVRTLGHLLLLLLLLHLTQQSNRR